MRCQTSLVLLLSLAAALPAEDAKKPELGTQEDLLSYLGDFQGERAEWDFLHVSILVKDARIGDVLDEITEEDDIEACYREGVLWIH